MKPQRNNKITIEGQEAELYHSALEAVIFDHFGDDVKIPKHLLRFVSDVNTAFWNLESYKNLMQRAYELNADRLLIANESLCIAREELEKKVHERTNELLNANRVLENEIITRKQMEMALLESEQEYRTLAEKLRLLSSEISKAEERERRRIASELHDSIVQTFVFCKLKIDSILKPAEGSALEEPLHEIFYFITKGLKELRSLIFDISPPVLYELGLEPAIESLAGRMHVQHGIALFFDSDRKEKPLHNDLKVLLYHAVRELLINLVKHSTAKNGFIYIKREADEIVITVEDDGKGFTQSESDYYNTKKNCFGLFNIRQRLSGVSGKMEIESGRCKGSRITLRAPIVQSSGK